MAKKTVSCKGPIQKTSKNDENAQECAKKSLKPARKWKKTAVQKHASTKQAVFIAKYLETFNPKESAIAAGYSRLTADSAGSRLLKVPKIRNEVDRLIEERAAAAEITAASVLKEIKEIGQEAREDRNQTAALKAQELLGKHLGLFADKIQQDTRIEIIIPGFDALPCRPAPAQAIPSPAKALDWDSDVNVIDISPKADEATPGGPDEH